MSTRQCAEAFASQFPSDTHIVSGCGGAGWNASNGGRLNGTMNTEYYKTIAMIARSARALENNQVSSTSMSEHYTSDAETTKAYTNQLMQTLEDVPAPGPRELQVGMDFTVVAKSWRDGPPASDNMEPWQCPDCQQSKVHGWNVTLKHNSSPEPGNPFYTVHREPFYLCTECFTLLREHSQWMFQAEENDVLFQEAQIAAGLLEGCPVGTPVTGEVTIDMLASPEFSNAFSIRNASVNLDLEQVRMVLGKVVSTVRKLNNATKEDGRSLKDKVRINRVSKEDVAQFTQKHDGLYEYRTWSLDRTDDFFQELMGAHGLHDQMNEPRNHRCDTSAMFTTLKKVCTTDTYQNIQNLLTYMKTVFGADGICSIHGLHVVWQACRDSGEIDLMHARALARQSWQSGRQGNKTLREYLDQQAKLYLAVERLERMHDSAFPGVGNFERVVQIRSGLNADSQIRFARAVSEVQRGQLHMSGTSQNVDCQSFQFVHDLLVTLCTEDTTNKQMDMFPTVQGEIEQLPAKKTSLEARIAALESGGDRIRSTEDDSGGKRGRGTRRQAGREKDKDKRPKVESPAAPTKHPKSKCPMCDGEHTISRCEKFERRSLKWNPTMGHHLHGADGTELCAREPGRCFWKSEQFKNSKMGKRNEERWNDIVKKAPDVAKKILENCGQPTPALGAIQDDDWDDDSSDSDGEVHNDRAQVAKFAAGQWIMLAGEGGTAPASQVPAAVREERKKVVAFVSEHREWSDDRTGSDSAATCPEVDNDLPNELFDWANGLLSMLGGAGGTAPATEVPDEVLHERERVVAFAHSALRDEARDEESRQDLTQTEGSVVRHGNFQYGNVERSQVLQAELQENLVNRWSTVEGQETSTDRHSRVHSAAYVRRETPSSDSIHDQNSAEGGGDDEVHTDPEALEHRVAAQVVVTGGGQTSAGVEIPLGYAFHAGPCPHGAGHCGSWSGCEKNNTGGVTEGAKCASANDNDGPDVHTSALSAPVNVELGDMHTSALAIENMNRKYHIVRARRETVMTVVEQAEALMSISNETHTSIEGIPTECGRILYFRIYGGGHAVAQTKELLAQYWEIDLSPCVLNAGIKEDVDGENRFLATGRGDHVDSSESDVDCDVDEDEEHERRVADFITTNSPSWVPTMLHGDEKIDVSNLAAGVGEAGASDSDDSDVCSQMNRRVHIVRAHNVGKGTQYRTSWTDANKAATLADVTCRTRTRILASTTEDGRIVYFRIYGDGHDCFYAARLLALHWDVDEHPGALTVGDKRDVAGEIRFLDAIDALYRSLREIDARDRARARARAKAKRDGVPCSDSEEGWSAVPEGDNGSDSEGGGDVDCNDDENGTEHAAYCQSLGRGTVRACLGYCRTVGFTIKACRAPPRAMFAKSTSGLAPESAATQNRVIADIQHETRTDIECKVSDDGAFTYFTIRGATVDDCERAAQLLSRHFDVIDGQSSIDESNSDADNEDDSDPDDSGADDRGGGGADGACEGSGDKPAPGGPDVDDQAGTDGTNDKGSSTQAHDVVDGNGNDNPIDTLRCVMVYGERHHQGYVSDGASPDYSDCSSPDYSSDSTTWTDTYKNEQAELNAVRVARIALASATHSSDGDTSHEDGSDAGGHDGAGAGQAYGANDGGDAVPDDDDENRDGASSALVGFDAVPTTAEALRALDGHRVAMQGYQAKSAQVPFSAALIAGLAAFDRSTLRTRNWPRGLMDHRPPPTPYGGAKYCVIAGASDCSDSDDGVADRDARLVVPDDLVTTLEDMRIQKLAKPVTSTGDAHDTPTQTTVFLATTLQFDEFPFLSAAAGTGTEHAGHAMDNAMTEPCTAQSLCPACIAECRAAVLMMHPAAVLAGTTVEEHMPCPDTDLCSACITARLRTSFTDSEAVAVQEPAVNFQAATLTVPVLADDNTIQTVGGQATTASGQLFAVGASGDRAGLHWTWFLATVAGVFAILGVLALGVAAMTNVAMEYVAASIGAVVILRLSNYGIDMWHACHGNRVPADIKDQWAAANAFAAHFGGQLPNQEPLSATCVDNQYSVHTRHALQSASAGTVAMVDAKAVRARKVKRPTKEDLEHALRELHDMKKTVRFADMQTRTRKKARTVAQAVDDKSAKQLEKQQAKAKADLKPPDKARHQQHQKQLCYVNGLLAMIGNAVAINVLIDSGASHEFLAMKVMEKLMADEDCKQFIKSVHMYPEGEYVTAANGHKIWRICEIAFEFQVLDRRGQNESWTWHWDVLSHMAIDAICGMRQMRLQQMSLNLSTDGRQEFLQIHTALPTVQQFALVPHQNKVITAAKTGPRAHASSMGSLSVTAQSINSDSVDVHDCKEGGAVNQKDTEGTQSTVGIHEAMAMVLSWMVLAGGRMIHHNVRSTLVMVMILMISLMLTECMASAEDQSVGIVCGIYDTVSWTHEERQSLYMARCVQAEDTGCGVRTQDCYRTMLEEPNHGRNSVIRTAGDNVSFLNCISEPAISSENEYWVDKIYHHGTSQLNGVRTKSWGEAYVFQESDIPGEVLGQLCPLGPWLDSNEVTMQHMVARMNASDKKTSVDPTSPEETRPDVERTIYTDTQVLDAMVHDQGPAAVVKLLHAWAITHKRTPESLPCGTPLHVDFLYSMFTRNSPTEWVLQARASGTEMAWKKVIADNAALYSDHIGCMQCEPFKFELTDPKVTSKRRMYPMSPHKTAACSKLVQVLIDNGVLEPSGSTEWNSPVLLIAKPDGRFRFIVDFSHVNRLVKNLPVTYPRPEDLLDFCTNAKFMAQIDCKDFYFCREVAEECRDCLTFTVPSHGALRFTRLPQGFIASSAAAIVPVINQMRGVLFKNALMHSDDVLLWAENELLCLEVFEHSCRLLREFGLTTGCMKVYILMVECNYVSHVISNGRAKPDPRMKIKLDLIKDPVNVSEVRTFCGMVQYYASYIPLLAHYRTPLTDLTCDHVEWKWTPEHANCVRMIKTLLASAVIYVVDWDKDIWVVTDASEQALGGCLMMLNEDGVFLPLRYMSRTLSKLERRYENRERELRAAVYCFKKCESIIMHRPFYWATDHANAEFILKSAESNMRIARLALWMSMFWYKLVHLAGKHPLMQIADALSRLKFEPDSVKNVGSEVTTPFEDATVQAILTDHGALDLQAAKDGIRPEYQPPSGDPYIMRDGTVELRPNRASSPRATVESEAPQWLVNGLSQWSSPITTGVRPQAYVTINDEFGISARTLRNSGQHVVCQIQQDGNRADLATSDTDHATVLHGLSNVLDDMKTNDIVFPQIHGVIVHMTPQTTPALAVNHEYGTLVTDTASLVEGVAKQGGWPFHGDAQIPAITFLFTERGALRHTYGLMESLFGEMGYQLNTSHWSTSEAGDSIHKLCYCVHATLPDRVHHVQPSASATGRAADQDLCLHGWLAVTVASDDATVRSTQPHPAITEQPNGPHCVARHQGMPVYSAHASVPLPRTMEDPVTITRDYALLLQDWQLHTLSVKDYLSMHSMPLAVADWIMTEVVDDQAKLDLVRHVIPGHTTACIVQHMVNQMESTTIVDDKRCHLVSMVVHDHEPVPAQCDLGQHTFCLVQMTSGDNVHSRHGVATIECPNCQQSFMTRSQRRQHTCEPAVPAAPEENLGLGSEPTPPVDREDDPEQLSDETPLVVTDSTGTGTDAESITITTKDILAAQSSHVDIKQWRQLVVMTDRIHAEPDGAARRGIQQELLTLKTKLKVSKADLGMVQHMFLGDDGVLMFADANRRYPVPVITTELGQTAMNMGHEQLATCHLGITKLIEWVRMRYWWPKMSSDCIKHVRSCLTCQRHKFTASPGYGFMNMRYYQGPAKDIVIDIVVLNDGTNLLTLLCSFAHYPDAYVIKDQEAGTCATALLKWVHTWGVPETVRSDRGQQLNISLVFKEMYALLGIKGQLSAAWSPQSQRVERFHRWLGAALRICFETRDLPVVDSLGFCLMAFRASVSRVTGYTPNLLMTGREARFPTDNIASRCQVNTGHGEYAEHQRTIMLKVLDSAQAASQMAQESSARSYNEQHGGQTDLCDGDDVFLKSFSRNHSDITSKLMPPCTGPWKVVKHNSKGAWLKHHRTGEQKPASMRHIRKAVVPHHVLQERLSNFAVHDFVVVQLFRSLFKWSVAQLIECTADQDRWLVRWFGTATVKRVDAEFLPVWATYNEQGTILQEVYATHKPHARGRTYEACTGCVKIKHVIGVAFKIAVGVKCRLPPGTKAELRTKYRATEL